MGVSASWRKDCNRWEITVRRNGRRKRKLAPPGMGKREAIVAVGDELVETIRLELEATEAVEDGRPPTLWDFCSEVYSERHGVSPRTWLVRKYKVAGIMEDLGHLPLDEVTNTAVEDWIAKLTTKGAPMAKGGRGKPLAPDSSMLNDYTVTLLAVYRVARRLGFIEANPFTVKVRQPSLEPTESRTVWSLAMKAAFLEAARALDAGMGRLGEFLMLTGCRPKEARLLRWADYTEEGGRKFIRITGKRRNNQARNRKLTVTGRLRHLLDGTPRLGEAVFSVEHGPTAGGCYTDWPTKRWARVCSEAGVPTAPYDLRHTFITEQVTKGVPLWQVAKWSGNSVRVIEESYAHLQPGTHDEMAALADEAMPPLPSNEERPQETSSDEEM